MRIEFIVPGKPVPQERPRVYRNRAFDPDKSRAAKRTIAQYALVARQSYKTSILTCEIYLKVTFYGAGGDIDNHCKTVMDALNGVLWHDDKQVTRLEAEKVKGSAQPRTEIVLYYR